MILYESPVYEIGAAMQAPDGDSVFRSTVPRRTRRRGLFRRVDVLWEQSRKRRSKAEETRQTRWKNAEESAVGATGSSRPALQRQQSSRLAAAMSALALYEVGPTRTNAHPGCRLSGRSGRSRRLAARNRPSRPRL